MNCNNLQERSCKLKTSTDEKQVPSLFLLVTAIKADGAKKEPAEEKEVASTPPLVCTARLCGSAQTDAETLWEQNYEIKKKGLLPRKESALIRVQLESNDFKLKAPDLFRSWAGNVWSATKTEPPAGCWPRQGLKQESDVLCQWWQPISRCGR